VPHSRVSLHHPGYFSQSHNHKRRLGKCRDPTSRTTDEADFPLSKGMFHQWHRCLTESGFSFSFGRREAATGWQYRGPVPVRTSVPPHFNISSVTSPPCRLQSFSNCCSLQLVSDRQYFPLSALIQGQNGSSTLRYLQLRSPVTAGIP
jgi:hypothetical protein